MTSMWRKAMACTAAALMLLAGCGGTGNTNGNTNGNDGSGRKVTVDRSTPDNTVKSYLELLGNRQLTEANDLLDPKSGYIDHTSMTDDMVKDSTGTIENITITSVDPPESGVDNAEANVNATFTVNGTEEKAKFVVTGIPDQFTIYSPGLPHMQALAGATKDDCANLNMLPGTTKITCDTDFGKVTATVKVGLHNSTPEYSDVTLDATNESLTAALETELTDFYTKTIIPSCKTNGEWSGSCGSKGTISIVDQPEITEFRMVDNVLFVASHAKVHTTFTSLAKDSTGAPGEKCNFTAGYTWPCQGSFEADATLGDADQPIWTKVKRSSTGPSLVNVKQWEGAWSNDVRAEVSTPVFQGDD